LTTREYVDVRSVRSALRFTMSISISMRMPLVSELNRSPETFAVIVAQVLVPSSNWSSPSVPAF